MQIIYLDQNQWIRLARAMKSPCNDADIAQIGAKLSDAVANSKICLPLTAANIYETYKINDSARREDLAVVQSCLSGGQVFVNRHARLAEEVGNFVREVCGFAAKENDRHWFISNVFFEAFADHSKLPFSISEELLTAIRSNPQWFLFHYWMSPSEEVRREAVRNWSAGSEQLRQRVERRRAKLKDETVKLRRKIYSAGLFSDELDLILKIAQETGAQWRSLSDIGRANALRIIRDVPTYYVEREIVLRLENQYRPIDENDFRDMESFCAVIPYADYVIAEKQFINLALQAGLNRQYNTKLATDLGGLMDLF